MTVCSVFVSAEEIRRVVVMDRIAMMDYLATRESASLVDGKIKYAVRELHVTEGRGFLSATEPSPASPSFARFVVKKPMLHVVMERYALSPT